MVCSAVPALPHRSVCSTPTASQLRQENTELRHRLRKFEGRSLPSGSGPASAVSAAASQQNGELLLAYSKLKRQHEGVKKELNAATMAYDRLRTESVKEITRLKLQVVGDSSGSRAQSTETTDLVKRLRAQCVQLKKELDTERTEHKRCILRHQRELANLRHKSSTYPSRSSSPSLMAASVQRSSYASGLPPRPTSTGSTRTSRGSTVTSNRRSPAPPSAHRSSGSAKDIPSSTRRSNSPLYEHAVGDRSPESTSRLGARDRYARSGSRSPSPTTERPPWNAGGGKKNAGYESGYSSAGSAGSRHSKVSAHSGQSSVASSRSGKRSKKKVQSPAYSDDSDVPNNIESEVVAARKKKSTKKSKKRKESKERARSALDFDILARDSRDDPSSLLSVPREARSPPREVSRRSRDMEEGYVRNSWRRSSEGEQVADQTLISARRSADSRDGLHSSPFLQDGMLGSHFMSTHRLDPNSFPVSKATPPESREPMAEDKDDDEAMRRAFDGLTMTRRSNSARGSADQSLRRSIDSQASETRRSREGNFLHSESGTVTSRSKPVVITRSGPPRETRERPVDKRPPPSESEEEDAASGGENDISEIDKRIKALQSFLDKAR